MNVTSYEQYGLTRLKSIISKRVAISLTRLFLNSIKDRKHQSVFFPINTTRGVPRRFLFVSLSRGYMGSIFLYYLISSYLMYLLLQLISLPLLQSHVYFNPQQKEFTENILMPFLKKHVFKSLHCLYFLMVLALPFEREVSDYPTL